MEANFNNIDEIEAYHNDDGSYSIELYISTATGDRMTVKMPHSSLDINLASGYDGMSVELKLEGKVSSL